MQPQNTMITKVGEISVVHLGPSPGIQGTAKARSQLFIGKKSPEFTAGFWGFPVYSVFTGGYGCPSNLSSKYIIQFDEENSLHWRSSESISRTLISDDPPEALLVAHVSSSSGIAQAVLPPQDYLPLQMGDG